MKYILSLYCLLAALSLHSQRVVIPMNDNWQFAKEAGGIKEVKEVIQVKEVNWEAVHLPHTWNAEDVTDDTPGYYRGVAWYRKKFSIDKAHPGKELFLHFEAANQETTVYINDKKAGEHTGGYTAFNIPITSLVHEGDNIVLVKVDNRHNRNIPPLTADFTFYGGIYRDVSLIMAEPVHFSFNEFGSKGVYVSTPEVNAKTAKVHIRSVITNNEPAAKKIKISTTIYDKKNKKVAGVTGIFLLEQGSNKSIEQVIPSIKHPELWSPDRPYLYCITTTITDASTGKILDEIVNPLGLRWFHFDAEKGFFLNGQPLKIVGASRHQDYKGLGNAVPHRLAIRDVELLKEMGGNFLRVAHYPQDPVIMETCDRLGILASVEIPIVNEITETDSFYNNCERMQTEMIRQHFNHPSVIMWCYMNEVLLRPQFNGDKERQAIYFSAITKLAKRLDSLTRKEDPYRYTMIAHHGDFNKYRDQGLLDVAMIVGWNLYSGWYGASLKDFPAFLDQFHKAYPNKPMMVTEYGADADPRIRSQQPARFDKSVEYTTTFHQYYMKEMMQRPFVAGAMIWNLADFNSETRTESMPHINNKGLLEWDRTPKDPYYYYRAVLAKEPFVKILGPSVMSGLADSGAHTTHHRVQVASNINEVELIVNGRSAGKKKPGNGIAEWDIAFMNGVNDIRANGLKDDRIFRDHARVEYRMLPYQLNDRVILFRQLNILLGANRSYMDEEKQLWLPNQPYREGSWGNVGGKPFKLNNGRLPYGTDKNIINTYDDPVYQTQQVGIEKYKVDVPAGEYELTLHFAELLGGAVKELAYNLSPADKAERIEPNGKRVFDVYVNGNLLLENFNIAEQFGSAVAVSKTTRVNVTGSQGIEIVFKAIEGEPVLNALQVKKAGLVKQEDVNVIK